MTCGIYGIFDSKTDECLYIGQSKNIENRWKQHLKQLKYRTHNRPEFSNWYHDNGANPSLLVFRLLEECVDEYLIKNSAESRWFETLSPKYYGSVPSASMRYHYNHTRETREKIGKSNKGKAPWHKNDPLEPIGVVFSRECPNCKNLFQTKKKDQKFCSRKCLGENRINNSKSEYTYDYIYDLYWNQGLSRPQLAEKLGIGKTKAFDVMKRLGVPRREMAVAQAMNQRSSEQVSKTLKALPRTKCSICGRELSIIVIKKHETSCATMPNCSVCGIKLKKRTSKTCQEHRFNN